MDHVPGQLGFLSGGGEMGALMRAHDWEATPLGAPETWPQSLRTSLSICLNAPGLATILWGPDLRMLYNDGYIASMADRHPAALGRPVSDVWGETWDAVAPRFHAVLATGEGMADERVPLEMVRRGRRETSWWNFSASPIRGEDGSIVGLLNSGVEITDQVLADARLKTQRDQLKQMFEQAPTFMALLSGPDHRIDLVNPGYSKLVGHRPVLGRTVAEALPDAVEQGYLRLLDSVMQSGQAHVGNGAKYAVQVEPNGPIVERFVDFVFQPLKDQSGQVTGIFIEGADVTDRTLAAAALQRSEAQTRLLLDSSAEGFYAIDRHGATVRCNQAFLTMVGLASEAELVGRNLHDLIHHTRADGSHYPEAECPIFRCARTGEPYHVVEEPFFRPDGSSFPAEYWVRPVIEDGELQGAICTLLDISERKAAQAALLESESRFRLIADSTPVPIWVTRLDRKREFVNRAYVDFLGISYEEAVDFDWRLALHPEDMARVMREQVEKEALLRPFVLEARYRDKFGDWRWLRSESQPRFSPTGEHMGFIGAASDVTEARRAAEVLAALNDTLESRVAERTRERDRVWQNSRDLIVTVDNDGIFREVSPSWEATLGHRPEEVVNRNFWDFLHPDDIAKTKAALGEVFPHDNLTLFENRYLHKDGSFRWISWNTSAEGDIVYAYGRDVTAEREQAQALRHTEELLRQSQKMEAVGQLTGGLAHDFNNLLAGISGSLEMLQARLEQGRISDLERYITAAQSASTRAAALTHRLLAFSRRQTLDPKAVDANRLVSGMEDLIRRTVGPEVVVEVVGAVGLWTTRVDPNQLENALLNLCINARDAMPNGGRLTIETSNKWLDDKAGAERDLAAGPYLALSVSDTGVGMTPEVIGRAFDPFYTTKPIGMGTGLGLSMTYGFARQSGGQARIYSEPAMGTTVCLYLPRHEGASADHDSLAAPLNPERAEPGETVLIVDDEPTVRMLVADVLGDFGYVALEAGEGAAALQWLRSNVRIDLLITDVGLPGDLNGRQVADAARVLRPGLKVLFITGYAENAIFGGFLEPGMHVMTKPFGMDALTAKIRELMHREKEPETH